MVQLSHPYMTPGKSLTLARWTFVSPVISLLFNMLYWFVITFLPRIKHLLISYTSCSYKFLFLVLKNFKTYTLSSFLVYNTTLSSLITRLYIASPELIFLITRSVYLLTIFTRLTHPILPTSLFAVSMDTENHQSVLCPCECNMFILFF